MKRPKYLVIINCEIRDNKCVWVATPVDMPKCVAVGSDYYCVEKRVKDNIDSYIFLRNKYHYPILKPSNTIHVGKSNPCDFVFMA